MNNFTSTRYKFSIEELQMEAESFPVQFPSEKTIYDIVEEAARLFYFGKRGFFESWPLRFTIFTLDNTRIAKADVYILSSIPTFDVILVTK